MVPGREQQEGRAVDAQTNRARFPEIAAFIDELREAGFEPRVIRLEDLRTGEVRTSRVWVRAVAGSVTPPLGCTGATEGPSC